MSLKPVSLFLCTTMLPPRQVCLETVERMYPFFFFFFFENTYAKSSSAVIRAVCRIDMPTVKTRLVVSTRKELVSCGEECLTKCCSYSHKNGIYLVTSDKSGSNDNSLAYI